MEKRGKFKLNRVSAIGFITGIALMTTSSQALNTSVGAINIKSPKFVKQNSITSIFNNTSTKIACVDNNLIGINNKNMIATETKTVTPPSTVTPMTPVTPVKPVEKVELVKNDLFTKYNTELSEYVALSYYDSNKATRYVNYKMKKQDISWENIITYVNIGLDNSYYTNITPITEPNSITVLANKYNQLTSDYVPKDLEKISTKYSTGDMKLRHEAKVAFETLCSAASKNGVKITAISTYRSYAKQDIVYWRYKGANETKATYQLRRDKVSARPGHSEHQTGLSVDVNGLEIWVENTEAFKWYSVHAHEYGFIIRYPKGQEHITGYSYEPWHLRYVGVELATDIYKSGLTYDEYYVRYLAPNVKVNTTLNDINYLQASTSKTLVKTIDNKKRA